MQIDYLLKFPSKAVAIQFGAATGLATQDSDGIWQASTATHDHALLEIGEHNGDGFYWILYRDLTGIPVPEGAEAFIYWASTSGEPRPVDANIPNVFWA